MNDERRSLGTSCDSTDLPHNCAILDIQEDICFLLAGAYRYVTRLCGEEFATYGITPVQFIVLMHLEADKSDSQRCLSRITRIDRTTIVGVVDRLEQKGLVLRNTVAEDRRVHRVVLTEYGQEIKNHLAIAAKRVRSKLTNKISSKEYKELSRLLEMVCQ